MTKKTVREYKKEITIKKEIIKNLLKTKTQDELDNVISSLIIF